MNKQNLEKLAREVEKKAEKRKKKRRLKMKVSGASVRQLQKIIKNNFKF